MKVTEIRPVFVVGVVVVHKTNFSRICACAILISNLDNDAWRLDYSSKGDRTGYLKGTFQALTTADKEK